MLLPLLLDQARTRTRQLPVLGAELVKVEEHLQQGPVIYATATEKALVWSGGEIILVSPIAERCQAHSRCGATHEIVHFSHVVCQVPALSLP